MSKNAITKARYWTGVLYPENMIENWEDKIPHLLQLPFAYCVHTADTDTKSEHRKDHVHLIVAHNNTTTYKHAMSIFNLLSAPDCKAINTCEAVIDIRHMYDYLIHDTEDCQKKGKELYSPDCRITGNNFDIGAYEQLGIAEKNDIFIKLSQAIVSEQIMNYSDFYEWVILNGESVSWLEIMRTYSGHFERLTKGQYQKYIMKEEQLEQHEKQHEQHEICCPVCGSVDYKKNGKTLANTQRFKCKDCGKVYTSYNIYSWS